MKKPQYDQKFLLILTCIISALVCVVCNKPSAAECFGWVAVAIAIFSD